MLWQEHAKSDFKASKALFVIVLMAQSNFVRLSLISKMDMFKRTPND